MILTDPEEMFGTTRLESATSRSQNNSTECLSWTDAEPMLDVIDKTRTVPPIVHTARLVIHWD